MKAAEWFPTISANFMTPGVMEYLDLPDGRMVELSRGRDFDNNEIFGVSVALQPVDDEKPKWDEINSRLCDSLDEARAHIEGLK